MHKISHRYIEPLGVAFVLTAVAIAYWPGLTGAFVLDDYPQLVINDALKMAVGWTFRDLLAALASSDAGPLGRPIVMATFVLQRTLIGLDPWWYKLFNLVVHLLNTYLVFLLARLIYKINSFESKFYESGTQFNAALLAAAIWGLHPYNLTSVLYVVQRMTSISTLFSILALLFFLKARVGPVGILASVSCAVLSVASFIFAIFSKETALIVPVLCLAIEIVFLEFKLPSGKFSRLIFSSYATLFFFIFSALCYKYSKSPGLLSALYEGRQFSLEQRLASEAVIVLEYLRNIFVPDISSMGLHHDDFPYQNYTYLTPLFLVASFFHVIIIAFALLYRRRYKLFSFCVLFYYIGHILESTFWPLELIYEHRNYMPMIGVTIMIGSFGQIAHCTASIKYRIRLAQVFLPTLLFFSLLVRSIHWGDPVTFAVVEAEKHPLSGRANFDAGRELVVLMLRVHNPDPEHGVLALKYLEKSIGKGMVTVEPYLVGYQAKAQLNLELPEGFFDAFAVQLRTGYVPNGLYGLANGLLGLSRFPVPPLDANSLSKLFEEGLQNPRIAGVGRGHLLTAYSIFVAETLHDMGKAYELSEGAVVSAPNFIPFRQNAALMAFAAGNKIRAQDLLIEVESQDKIGVFKRETERLKSIFENNVG